METSVPAIVLSGSDPSQEGWDKRTLHPTDQTPAIFKLLIFPAACLWYSLYLPLRILPRDRQPREFLVSKHDIVMRWLAERTVDPCELYS